MGGIWRASTDTRIGPRVSRISNLRGGAGSGPTQAARRACSLGREELPHLFVEGLRPLYVGEECRVPEDAGLCAGVVPSKVVQVREGDGLGLLAPAEKALVRDPRPEVPDAEVELSGDEGRGKVPGPWPVARPVVVLDYPVGDERGVVVGHPSQVVADAR